ncbi:MAG: S-layer homology domain-containing protein [Firmicutes bacterium]|nr:S-layer homology domain-containing protein [Bacillota bacterium]
MKRQIKALALILGALLACALLSGCALTSYGVDFKDDGSVGFLLESYTPESLIAENGETPEQFFADEIAEGAQLKSIEFSGETYWAVETEPLSFGDTAEFKEYIEDFDGVSVSYEGSGAGRRIATVTVTVPPVTDEIGEGEDAERSAELADKFATRLDVSFPGNLIYAPEDLDDRGGTVKIHPDGKGVTIITRPDSSEPYDVTVSGFIGAEPEGITEISFELPVPRAGMSPDYPDASSLEFKGGSARSVGAQWFVLPEDADPTDPDSWEEFDGVFEEGGVYGFQMFLEADGDSVFRPSAKAYVNGEESSQIPFPLVRDRTHAWVFASFEGDEEPKDPAEEGEQTIPFIDVKKDDYFYDAVEWAYFSDPQVTNGISETVFGPYETCTRGQVVTFLWRARGCPEPEAMTSSFKDVKDSDYFFKPVLWAVEEGITNGTTEDEFTPDQTCSNAHILTFIYRAVGSPGKTGEGAWWADALSWAKSEKLLDGTYSGEFDVDAGCPRANVVEYLFRY